MDCILTAILSDAMAPAAMAYVDPAGRATTLDLSCGLCFDIQRFHCYSMTCPDAATPYLVCDPRTDPDMCAGEESMLRTCLDGLVPGSPDEQAYRECITLQADTCFDLARGYLPAPAGADHSGGAFGRVAGAFQ
jgi:hypothetical protein